MKKIQFTIQGQHDINALRLAQVCTAGIDDPRYYLQAVCFTFMDPENIVVVGTNGAILAKTPVSLMAQENVTGRELIVQIEGAIPKNATEACFSLPNDYTSGYVTFRGKSGRPTEKVAQIINATYPNYTRMLRNLTTDPVPQEKITFNPMLIATAAAAVTPGHMHSNGVDKAFPIASVIPGTDHKAAMTVVLTHSPHSTVLIMPVRT